MTLVLGAREWTKKRWKEFNIFKLEFCLHSLRRVLIYFISCSWLIIWLDCNDSLAGKWFEQFMRCLFSSLNYRGVWFLIDAGFDWQWSILDFAGFMQSSVSIVLLPLFLILVVAASLFSYCDSGV